MNEMQKLAASSLAWRLDSAKLCVKHSGGRAWCLFPDYLTLDTFQVDVLLRSSLIRPFRLGVNTQYKAIPKNADA